MTSREEFEAWCIREGSSPEWLNDGDHELMWMGWQAGRAQALEEAAQECDKYTSAQYASAWIRLKIHRERRS